MSGFYRGLPVLRELFQIRDSIRRVADLQSEALMHYSSNRFDRQDPLRLTSHARQVNSMAGQDGMLREVFRRIGEGRRYFVELGAGDGVQNNTAFLVSQGWFGVWVDSGAVRAPHPVLYSSAWLTRENAASILGELGVPEDFDLLSIDLDRNTYHVWDGLRRYRPRVVVIEYNAALPPDMDWHVDYDPVARWDGSTNFGASLKAIERLGRELGYVLVGCDPAGVDAFLVREEFSSHFAAPFTAENHYEPPRYSAICSRGHHRRAVLDRVIPFRGLASHG